jgi:hypothetical protein
MISLEIPMANLMLSPMSSDIFGWSVNQPVFKELGFILWTKWIGESNDQSKPISLLKRKFTRFRVGKVYKKRKNIFFLHDFCCLPALFRKRGG